MRCLLSVAFVVLAPACEHLEEPRSLAGVEVVGCAEFDETGTGAACEQDLAHIGEIRMWIPGVLPEVRIDGTLHTPSQTRVVDLGTYFTFVAPPGAAEVVLSRRTQTLHLETWTMTLTWRDSRRRPDARDLAMNLLFAAYNESQDGDCQRLASTLFQQAVTKRRWLLALRLATIGCVCSGRRRDIQAVRAWREALVRVPLESGGAAVYKANVAAKALLDEGEPHAVLVAVERGMLRAERLAMTTMQSELLSLRAAALAELGEFPDAIALTRAALDRRLHPLLEDEDEVALRVQLAWLMVSYADRAELEGLREAKIELRRALALVEERCERCPAEFGLAVRLRLAHVLLRLGDRHALDCLRDDAAGLTLGLKAELGLMRAHLRLAEGDLAAARGELELPGIEELLTGDETLDLWVTRGDVAEREGDLSTARTLYLRALRSTLDRVGTLSPADGLQRFVFDRRVAAQRLLTLLLGPFDDAQTAFQVARESGGTDARWLARRAGLREPRSRASDARAYLTWRDEAENDLILRWDLRPTERGSLLRSVEHEAERRAMALLGDAEGPGASWLREPVPGELLLLYVPTGHDRMIGFAATADGISVATIERASLPPLSEAGLDDAQRAEWGTRLLDPFDRAIERAVRIRILPSVGLHALPFHALLWRDRPLLVHLPVEYSLDLPPGSSRPEPARHALLVGDPVGDLDGARSEVNSVSDRLRARGLEVTELVGRAATGPALRSLLPLVDHFHYAGHSATAGAFGWRSTLRLADDTTLNIADILALDRVPRTATLLSCSAGGVRPDPRSQGVTLTAAFLLAGSEAVIAPSIDIDATGAQDIAEALQPVATGAVDVPASYRAGMLRLLTRTGPSPTWQALRLWVP